MKKQNFTKFLGACATLALVATSCEKEVTTVIDETVQTGDSRFVVATEIGDAVYLMTTESLSEGSITAVNNGTEVNAGSVWQYIDNKYLFSINEIGGNDPVDVRGYSLNASTNRVEQIGYYSTTKYNAWGAWGENFAYMAYLSNSTKPTNVDADGTEYSPIDIYYTIASPISGQAKYSNISAEGFLLNSQIAEADRSPETVNFPCFAEAGGKVYVSIATQGVSKYSTLDADFETNMQNFITNNGLGGTPSDYVAKGSGKVYTIAGTEGVSGYNSSFSATDGVPFPLSPDKVRIAVYSSTDLAFGEEPEAFISSDLMGQAYGRYYGNPYSTIASNGDYVYVFSPAAARRYSDYNVADEVDGTELVDQYNTTETTDWNESTKLSPLRKVVSSAKASVMRIKAGETEFDMSYQNGGVLELESLLGDYTFTRVWHLDGDLFLLRVMNEDKKASDGYYYEFHKNTPTDARFAIFNAATGTATYISGLPTTSELREDSSSIGEPCFSGDQVFIPMSLTNESAVYVVNNINSASPAAIKGLSVEADIVLGVGLLQAQ
ncbi:MAG: DUF4374 domain-containing protein [Rikenellaceae bacterium]